MLANYQLGNRAYHPSPLRFGEGMGCLLRRLGVVFWCVIGLGMTTGCARQTSSALSYNDSYSTELREQLQAGQKGGAAAAAVSAAEPTGWATLKGKFSLTGT